MPAISRGLCGLALVAGLAACRPIRPPEAPSPTATATPDPAPTAGPTRDPLAGQRAEDGGRRRHLPWAASDTQPTAGPPTVAAAGGTPAGCPAGMVLRQGAQLLQDGQPVFLFGLNAPFLLDDEYPEERVGPLLAALSDRGVNTLRVWYFRDNDAERFARLLDLGREHGIRFVVTLGDNVHRGRDWFFGEEDEEKFRPHLVETVTRFKDRPEIAAWEAVNEPNCGGNYDEDCVKVIKDWVTMASGMIADIDPCHAVSSGMIGDGNFEAEAEAYRAIHKKDAVTLVSQHRRATDEKDDEVAMAEDIDRPIVYGEVYHKAYDTGCEPLEGGQALRERVRAVTEDLEHAIDAGVDGYLLWEINGGRVKDREYCSEFGFALDDPLWPALADAKLPPPVPWRR